MGALLYPIYMAFEDITSKWSKDDMTRFITSGQFSALMTMTRETVNLRYSLLSYMYTTLSRELHATAGLPMVRSLLTEFPNDTSSEILIASERQFMLGSSLLVSPILDAIPPGGTLQHAIYFPQGYTYYELNTGTEQLAGATQLL